MTVFLDVLKHFLVSGIEQYRAAAGGYWNNDKELTTFKSSAGETLAQKIWAIEDRDSEIDTIDAIKKLIKKTLKKVRDERVHKKASEGNFEPTLRTLLSAMDILHGEFEKRKLLAVVPEIDPIIKIPQYNSQESPNMNLCYRYRDPYDIFVLHIGLYLAEKALQEASIRDTFSTVPIKACSVELTEKKIGLALMKLQSCKKLLEASEDDREYYRLGRKEGVLNVIQALLFENKVLCKRYTVTKNVPLSPLSGWNVNVFSVGIGTFVPKLGNLEDYMGQATEQIEKRIVEKKPGRTHARGKEKELEKEKDLKGYRIVEDYEEKESETSAFPQGEKEPEVAEQKKSSMTDGPILFQKPEGNTNNKRRRNRGATPIPPAAAEVTEDTGKRI